MYHQRRHSWAQMVIFDRLADVELVFPTALHSPSSAEGFPPLSDWFTGVGSEVAHQISTLATVRRANRACSFPAHGFHKDSTTRGRKEGINPTRFTSPYSPKSVFQRPLYSFGTSYGRNTPIQSSSNRIELKEQRLNLHRVMLRSTGPIVKGFRVPVELWPTLPYAESLPTGEIFGGLSLQPHTAVVA
jgi:hypothetical protein